ncbi:MULTISPECIES: ABC transporter permease [unclassified Candidatus Cardinium]|uniref:ABC transporter permease n=1 Tax=unclassified Candidatus Cardinium TaxID=2641185 RepID=UPI001FB39D4A|nr:MULTISPECIES: ABC transporter permease [unclassified Candidatus Cardinium]
MLVVHAFKEAYQSLKAHASRTLSMGFGVLWAIFILVLLLGIGNGFHNGIVQAFAKYGIKTMFIWQGRNAGKDCRIPLEMGANVSQSFNNTIDHLSPILGYHSPIKHETKTISSSILGCDPCYASLAHLPIQEGRFFTPRDTIEVNNICVIGANIKEKLFGAAPAIGKYIFWGTIGLQVVGVLDTLDVSSYNESDAILLTNNLFTKLFPKRSHYVSAIRLRLVPSACDQVVEKQLRAYFARHLHFDAKDTKGISIFSIAQHAAKFDNFFKNIAIFNGIVGICLLITGIVGISNMMLVTIQERKQEMAIRKVLGSRSIEIVAMILAEVVIVTLIAGMVGLTVGFSLMGLLNKWVVPSCKAYYLSTLTCPAWFILGGLGLITLASCLAGILPAIRAVNIKPVDTLGSK